MSEPNDGKRPARRDEGQPQPASKAGGGSAAAAGGRDGTDGAGWSPGRTPPCWPRRWASW